MSNPVADEPDATAPGASTSTVVEADGPDEQRLDEDGSEERDRSQTSEDASARDWADTGDPAHEPTLPADHPDGPSQTPSAAGPAGRSASEPAVTEGAQDAAGDRAPTDLPPSAAPPPSGDGRADVPPADLPAPDLPAPDVPAPDVPITEPGPRAVVRATGAPRRPPLLVQGLWPALLAGALAAASSFGLLPLAVAVLAVQVFLVLGALALLDAPAAGGAFLVATGTTLAADVLVVYDDGEVTGLAGAVGLGLVASLVHQLSRKKRSRVTESLADTLVVVVVAVAGSCLLALRQVDGGEQVLLVSLAATGAVLLAGRVGDRLAPRPMLAIGSTRGWPGLLLGLGAGVACALVVADLGGELPLRSAALLGLVVASTVATADLAVDLGAAELRSGWRDARRVAALRPTALLLPYAVLGPVALLAGRLVLG